MKRAGDVFLIDWDPAHAAETAAALEKAGRGVRVESEDGARALKHMVEDPPDVLVIDLRRLPTLGRETARSIRVLKELQDLPVVFVEGDDGAGRAKAAGAVPNATFTTAEDLVHVLNRLGLGAV